MDLVHEPALMRKHPFAGQISKDDARISFFSYLPRHPSLHALGEESTHMMVTRVVPFEFWITEVQCKLRLNPQRSESLDAMLWNNQNDNAKELADRTQRLGMAGCQAA